MVDVPVPATQPAVAMRTHVTVASDHAGEVATPVIISVLRADRESAHPQEPVVHRQVGSAVAPVLGPGHVLPASVGEEAVIAAGDQRSAVLEGHPVGLLPGPPMSQDGGQDVPSVAADLDGPVDRIPDP